MTKAVKAKSIAFIKILEVISLAKDGFSDENYKANKLAVSYKDSDTTINFFYYLCSCPRNVVMRLSDKEKRVYESISEIFSKSIVSTSESNFVIKDDFSLEQIILLAEQFARSVDDVVILQKLKKAIDIANKVK